MRCSDSIVMIYALKCIRRWTGDALIPVRSYKGAVDLEFTYNALSNSSLQEKALIKFDGYLNSESEASRHLNPCAS